MSKAQSGLGYLSTPEFCLKSVAIDNLPPTAEAGVVNLNFFTVGIQAPTVNVE